jgi:hypothetical protein
MSTINWPRLTAVKRLNTIYSLYLCTWLNNFHGSSEILMFLKNAINKPFDKMEISDQRSGFSRQEGCRQTDRTIISKRCPENYGVKCVPGGVKIRINHYD